MRRIKEAEDNLCLFQDPHPLLFPEAEQKAGPPLNKLYLRRKELVNLLDLYVPFSH